jgi:pyruvate kinase
MTDIRRTKLWATLGPSTDGPGILARLFEAGLDAVRLNMSHGVHADHARRLAAVRRTAARFGRHVPVLFDLSGPKIRVGRLPEAGLQLVRHQAVRLVRGEGPTRPPAAGQPVEIPVPVPVLLAQARRGQAFLLKDGLLRLRVVRTGTAGVLCEVEEGGLLRSRQGIALPGSRLLMPALTRKDLADLDFGRRAGADVFALSFARSARDVRRAARLARGVPLVAKIERPEALEDLEAIILACEGVMVARGDLGVELGAERVPLAQKRVLAAANRHGKLAILATQMLASMEESPIPTRAEATDVANAVLDGADGLLLTGETAGGKFPVEAVRMLGRIVDEVERSTLYRTRPAPPLCLADCPEEALATAAAGLLGEQALTALVVLSRTGLTAGLLSDHRPSVPIVALAADDVTARRLALQWGVRPAVRNARAGRDVFAAVAAARRVLGVRGGPAWFGVLHGEPGGTARHLSLVRG